VTDDVSHDRSLDSFEDCKSSLAQSVDSHQETLLDDQGLISAKDFENLHDPSLCTIQLVRYEDKVFKATAYVIAVEVAAPYSMKAETRKTLDEFKTFHKSVSVQQS
jgi:hypothetical protein